MKAIEIEPFCEVGSSVQPYGLSPPQLHFFDLNRVGVCSQEDGNHLLSSSFGSGWILNAVESGTT